MIVTLLSSPRYFNNDDDDNNDSFDAFLDGTVINISLSITFVVIPAVIIRGAILDGGNSNGSSSGAFHGKPFFN